MVTILEDAMIKKHLLGTVAVVIASAVVVAVVGAPPAGAASVTPGGTVKITTTAVNGIAAQHLYWTTPAVQSGHASIANTTSKASASSVITMKDSAAPTSYSFTVALPAGDQLQPNGSGGIDVVAVKGGLAYTVGGFAAPWAKDATGKTLQTSYSLSGNTITQNVKTTGAKYPVTADPKFTWGWITGTI
jgi:hypothetical protein